jgi:DNA ligase-1
VTKQFPDVVEVIRENIKSDNYVLDSEIIGIDPNTKKWLAFQNISQRIKRKYDIHQMAKSIPVMVNVFDAMQVNSKNLLKTPFRERRAEIQKIVNEVPEKLSIARQIITDNPGKAQEFYKEALQMGNEGIMAKNLDAPYKPGSRVGYGIKIKPVMETLDLVIVGAEWGEGKRASWLSSFTIACIDSNGNFVEIGKVGTGIKEKEQEGVTFEQLTNLLKPLTLSEKGKEVIVKPQIVIEINYEEIQKSPTYASGYALRFPRLISIREDRSPEDISTIEQVEELYFSQRNK